jgi:hypothetical protein
MLRRCLGGVTTAILATVALIQAATAQATPTPGEATPVPHDRGFPSIDPGFVVIFEDQSNDHAFVVRWKDASNDIGFIAGGSWPIFEPPPATPTPDPGTPPASDW